MEGWIITSVTRLDNDGSTPRIAVKSMPEYKKKIKQMKKEKQAKKAQTAKKRKATEEIDPQLFLQETYRGQSFSVAEDEDDEDDED